MNIFCFFAYHKFFLNSNFTIKLFFHPFCSHLKDLTTLYMGSKKQSHHSLQSTSEKMLPFQVIFRLLDYISSFPFLSHRFSRSILKMFSSLLKALKVLLFFLYPKENVLSFIVLILHLFCKWWKYKELQTVIFSD